MDRAMFEGSSDWSTIQHEKPAWVTRLEEGGRTKDLMVKEASVGLRVLYYIVGYAAMAVGVFLLIGGLVNSGKITW